MQYKKLIISEIEFTKTFSFIAQAYEEIAVMKMKKIRKSVVTTREYLAKLSDVFFDVKRSYLKQKQEESLEQKLEHKAKPLVEKEKRLETVSVFLSANTTLYGDLIGRIFKLFSEAVKKVDSDIIIIGRVGRRLYEQQENKRPYLYFELPDIQITLEQLKPVIFHLVQYKNIFVYYGRFEDFANQVAIVSNVSGQQPFTKSETGLKEKLGMDFLFEPSLETLLRFFEDLIASSLFRQTVNEAQLARLASRIVSMEKAQDNIEIQIKKLRFLETKIIRQEQNNKQLERLAGVALWRK